MKYFFGLFRNHEENYVHNYVHLIHPATLSSVIYFTIRNLLVLHTLRREVKLSLLSRIFMAPMWQNCIFQLVFLPVSLTDL